MILTRRLIGSVPILFTIVIAWGWRATEWEAALLAHQSGLGQLWLIARRVRTYQRIMSPDRIGAVGAPSAQPVAALR